MTQGGRRSTRSAPRTPVQHAVRNGPRTPEILVASRPKTGRVPCKAVGSMRIGPDVYASLALGDGVATCAHGASDTESTRSPAAAAGAAGTPILLDPSSP